MNILCYKMLRQTEGKQLAVIGKLNWIVEALITESWTENWIFLEQKA